VDTCTQYETVFKAVDNFNSNEGQVDGGGSLVLAEDAKDITDRE